jgi:hypothetical protein
MTSTSPGFADGQVLTAPELNSAFIAKQDYPAVTPPPGDSSTAVATTAFVNGAVAGIGPGVTTFNARSGAVTLTPTDITNANGAPLSSPAFTGVPTAPTAALGINTAQLATTAFVQAQLAAVPVGGVSSFNSRTGAVAFTAADITTVNGALLASPTFTGVPSAPTAAPGTNSTQIATTAFVHAASGAGGATPAVKNITDFGGVGDGTTDNLTAFNNAISSFSPNGGTVYIPPGTWYSSNGWDIPSNINLQGAGPQTILIGNPSAPLPNNYTVIVYGTLTGSGNHGVSGTTVTYPINAPTVGTSTVTTTTAADAGNFNANDVISISGPKHGTGLWYPIWNTTVVSANASTGVITLAEPLILGGTALTLVQKVLVYPQNVRISDLTISIPAGANVGGFQSAFCKNVVLERVNSTTMSSSRHPYISMSATRGGVIINSRINGYLDFDACVDSIMTDNVIVNGVIALEGGCQSCGVINNSIENPQIGMPPSPAYGIGISSDSQFNRIIGNTITNVNSSQSGITLGQGNTAFAGNNVVSGNVIVGADTTIKGINLTTSQNNIISNNIINTAGTGLNILTSSSGQVVSGNQFVNVTANTQIDATSGIVQAPLSADSWAFTGNGTTSFNVTNNSLLTTNNTAATTFTGFTGGTPGQTVTLLINDANTTLQAGGSFVLMQTSNYSPPAGTMMRFINRNNIWYETSRLQSSTAAFQFPRGLTVGPNTGLIVSGPSFATAPPQNVTAASATITSTSATLAPTAACTLTLPTPTTGTWLHLVLTTAQAVTSASANIIPLAGGTAGTAIFSGTAPPHWCTMQANGTNWITFASA